MYYALFTYGGFFAPWIPFGAIIFFGIFALTFLNCVYLEIPNFSDRPRRMRKKLNKVSQKALDREKTSEILAFADRRINPNNNRRNKKRKVSFSDNITIICST